MGCMTDSTTPNPNASYWHADGTERTLAEYRSAVAGDQGERGERVTFTTTGATGHVLERFTRDGLGDLSGEWATVAFDDGETIDVVASSLCPITVECSTCHYPHPGDDCANPACPANPSLSDAARQLIAERSAQHAADEAERSERMRLYRSSFGAR